MYVHTRRQFVYLLVQQTEHYYILLFYILALGANSTALDANNPHSFLHHLSFYLPAYGRNIRSLSQIQHYFYLSSAYTNFYCLINFMVFRFYICIDTQHIIIVIWVNNSNVYNIRSNLFFATRKHSQLYLKETLPCSKMENRTTQVNNYFLHSISHIYSIPQILF